jgi:hypothetical protein
VGVVAFGVVSLGAFVARIRGHECTVAGCAPTAVVDLASLPAEVRAEAAGATVCLDDACSTQPVVAGLGQARSDLPASAVGSASIVLVDAGGAELARYESPGPLLATVTFPNGPDCPPPCPLLRLTVRDGLLVPAT